MRTLPLVLVLAACGPKQPDTAAAPEPAPEDPVASDVLAVMDASVDPCDDFYQYACGGWMSSMELPADRTRITRAFHDITHRNEELLRGLLDAAASDPGDDPLRQRVGAFYGACMDTEAVEAAGLAPLEPMLAPLAEVQTPEDLMREAGRIGRTGADVLFGAYVSPDHDDPNLVILHVMQGGYGLPERGYYLDDDEEKATLREAYRAHVAKMLELSGQSAEEAAQGAEHVLAFETKLAEASWEMRDLRDPHATWNRVDRAGLQELTPHLPWDAAFEALGQPELTQINVMTPSFFEGLDAAVADTEPEVWRAYLRWMAIHAAADHLPKAFVDEDFAFYGKTLNGQKALPPRWRTCVDLTDHLLGDLVGQLYVAEAFSGDAKPMADELVERIGGAFEARLPELEWMDETTRERAAEKARKVRHKVGHPDTWEAYEGLELSDGHLANVQGATVHLVDRELAKVGGPVDREEWHMSAPTVNAYYNPSGNEMVFPAGILQPPFFDPARPMAANFGAVGMVVGHELTHGFDDQGSNFDGDGRLVPWWDEAVVGRFSERAQCVDDHYAAFEVEPGLNLDGKLTLGENLADIGGARLALRAYRGWAEEHGQEAELAGLGPEQLFFVSFAQSWCSLATPEVLRVQVRTDPHSPARFRVNGTVRNLPEFATAFQCEPGDAMAPADTCEVW